MKNAIILFGVLAVALSGCVGSLLEPKADPTVFYIMRPHHIKAEVEPSKSRDVNLLSVVVPAYMNRQQIVSENGNSTELSEFNRWAEPVISGMERVLQDGIDSASDNVRVFKYPGISFNPNAVNVRVFISECIGSLGDSLKLKGSWQIDFADDTVEQTDGTFSISVPCGKTYADYVASIGAGLGQLSADIVKEIAILEKKKDK